MIEPSGKPHQRQAPAGRCHGEFNAVLGAAELDALIGKVWSAAGGLGWLKGKEVAATRHGLDDTAFLVVQGVPDISDALYQCVIGDEETRPDSPHQLVLADHPPPILDEMAQDIEGLRPQFDVLVPTAQRASLQV